MLGHFPELIIILVIALIVFGPEKLPEAAASAGKAVREMRQVMDSALHPQDEEDPEDFSTYYYESLERSGEEMPDAEEDFDPYEEFEKDDGDEVPGDPNEADEIRHASTSGEILHEDAPERASRPD